MKKKDLQKFLQDLKCPMPPYRPYERPENGGMRVIDEQKPIKLKYKRD